MIFKNILPRKIIKKEVYDIEEAKEKFEVAIGQLEVAIGQFKEAKEKLQQAEEKLDNVSRNNTSTHEGEQLSKVYYDKIQQLEVAKQQLEVSIEQSKKSEKMVLLLKKKIVLIKNHNYMKN